MPIEPNLKGEYITSKSSDGFPLSFSDDRYFAPPASIKALLSYYPAANSQYRLVTTKEFSEFWAS